MANINWFFFLEPVCTMCYNLYIRRIGRVPATYTIFNLDNLNYINITSKNLRDKLRILQKIRILSTNLKRYNHISLRTIINFKHDLINILLLNASYISYVNNKSWLNLQIESFTSDFDFRDLIKKMFLEVQQFFLSRHWTCQAYKAANHVKIVVPNHNR